MFLSRESFADFIFYHIFTCALVSHSIMVLLVAHFPRYYTVLFIGDYDNNKVRALDLSTSMVAISVVASCCRVNDATISIVAVSVLQCPRVQVSTYAGSGSASSSNGPLSKTLRNSIPSDDLSYSSACTASAGLNGATCAVVDSSGTMFVAGYCSNVVHSYISC